MFKMFYILHVDGGHGWLEVPIAEIEELGLQKDITNYSYLSHDLSTVYLEEDCDAPRFLEALENKGIAFENVINDCGDYAFCRQYFRYTPQLAFNNIRNIGWINLEI